MTYAVREIFNTLQGEGGRSGARSVFVRFAGCNMWNGRAPDRDKGEGACAIWCDTDFDPKNSRKMRAEWILEEVEALWPYNEQRNEKRWVVFSGGEPLLQLDLDLLVALTRRGFSIALETNGSTPIAPELREYLAWVCVSPKLRRSGEFDVADLRVRGGEECKVVLPGVAAGEGEGWTPEMLRALAAHTNFDHYFVQPMDPIDRESVDQSFLKNNLRVFNGHGDLYLRNLKRCIEFVNDNPTWRLSLQTHKLISLP